jgi:hypothetical protein
MRLHIGQSSFKGAFAGYVGKLDFLELLAEPHRLPKIDKLRSYRTSAPEGFVFSVVLSPVCLDESEEGKKALDYGLKVASAVDARWVVLRTPPSLRPGGSGERQVERLVNAIRATVAPSKIAWEPRGVWDGSAQTRVARNLGVQLVTDARDAVPGPRVYARMLRLGLGARTNSRLLEQLALAFIQSEEAFLVIDGGPAVPVKREFDALLEELVDDLAGDADLEDGFELDDDEAQDGDDDTDDSGAGEDPPFEQGPE